MPLRAHHKSWRARGRSGLEDANGQKLDTDSDADPQRGREGGNYQRCGGRYGDQGRKRPVRYGGSST